MRDLELLVGPGGCQNLWGPGGAQAIAEGNGLGITLPKMIGQKPLDDLICPCRWLPPNQNMPEQLWPLVPRLPPENKDIACALVRLELDWLAVHLVMYL